MPTWFREIRDDKEQKAVIRSLLRSSNSRKCSFEQKLTNCKIFKGCGTTTGSCLVDTIWERNLLCKWSHSGSWDGQSGWLEMSEVDMGKKEQVDEEEGEEEKGNND